MPSQIFVNLPVKDLKRSVDYFTRLGYTFNPQFTDDNATCMIVNDNIYVMLLVEPFFQTFTAKKIVDAREATEVLVALDFESRAAVDDIAEKALAAGGREPKGATDHGFMYTRQIEDLDGHGWEYFWMDPNGPPQA